MSDWFFPTRGYGELEGFSNPGLEMFKGNPIKAMAREICQNSLDAVRDTSKPVRIEFEKLFIRPTDRFPGIRDMENILEKCRSFWKKQKDDKTLAFIDDALKAVKNGSIFVLRVSDYNTTGLKGAFSEEEFTPWKSLVQGNAYSVKANDSAQGSFGIGKSAPFVVSKIQTVFYRTFDEDDVRAAQGVTHLVSFEDPDMSRNGEDIVRRATGYYGCGEENKPFHSIKELDELNERTEYGTDLFIPAFAFEKHKSSQSIDWTDEIIVEILENFLYSIYAGKLEVKIDDKVLKRKTLKGNIDRLKPKTKNAANFYEVIREDNPEVKEEIEEYAGLGKLRLRLLYKANMNKQILVVRNSGMKIAKIQGLPKSVSYSGFLEIQGEKLNAFFRGMENPQHDAWEPKRHKDPDSAKLHKSRVEAWVKEMIGKKIQEISGDEMDIDVGEYFNGKESAENLSDSEQDKNEESKENKNENIIDSVKRIEVIQEEETTKKFKVKDIGGESGGSSNKVSGTIDNEGNKTGHIHRGKVKRNTRATGRKGFSDGDGPDTIYDGMHEIYVTARIISKGNGINRMIFKAEEDITAGELEVVTMGENGKTLQLVVKSVNPISTTAEVINGHIKIHNVKAYEKNILEFSIHGNKNYAMGVRAYGN